MFSSSITFLALSLGTTSLAALTGSTGTLSSLDGGLGGVVTVKDPTTLSITSYTLKDASAPALYWWGTTTTIKNGFRISNTQVTKAASTNAIEIVLDAGKTAADFDTVGLWCERLNANFGQATLTGGSGSGGSTGNTTVVTTPAASTSAAPTSTAKSAGNTMVSSKMVLGAFIAAAGFAVLMG